MSTRDKRLSREEIRAAFADSGVHWSPILSPKDLAQIVGQSVKTIYQWGEAGRLDGAFRKRGKHILIWRDRAIDKLFNGPEWTNQTHEQ
jgi:hypothetical protein